MLVLSLFPGIGLLDMAFELEGFCVVRGPDCIWGGDIRRFTPPAGKFDGVIGGPPCQAFSRLRHLNKLAGMRTGNLIPEFERCVIEANPTWFLMENVAAAPVPFGSRCEIKQLSEQAEFNRPGPIEDYYTVHSFLFNNRWLGEEQERVRRFCFGTRDGRKLNPEIAVFESPVFSQCVTRSMTLVPVKIGGSGKVKRTYLPNGAQKGPASGPRVGVGRMLELQGLAADHFDDCPLTADGLRKAIGNGVPLPMGRAIAKAVLESLKA